MSDTPTATDLARDALQSEFNDLDVSGALVHAVEMFVEAKIKEMGGAIRADEREACAKVAEDYAEASWGMIEEEHAARSIASSIRNRTET